MVESLEMKRELSSTRPHSHTVCGTRHFKYLVCKSGFAHRESADPFDDSRMDVSATLPTEIVKIHYIPGSGNQTACLCIYYVLVQNT